MSKPQIVDPSTGEIVQVKISKSVFKPPKAGAVTPIDQVAGKNPPAVNLKDHPEFSGMELTIMDAKWKKSTLGGHLDTYLLLACFITTPGTQPKESDYVILMTGAENVQARIADAEMAAGEGSPYPLKGILRASKGGRAWFLD